MAETKVKEVFIESEDEDLKTAKEEEQVFGERLLDDLMNTFCDHLQKVATDFEGFLAIQYIMTTRTSPSFWKWLCCARGVECEEIRKHISGKKPVLQIVYDADRIHYVVLRYDPKKRSVTLYDSLVNEDMDSVMTSPVVKQILALFGHLFPNGEVVLNVELNYERQVDSWSCGYRAVACVTDLARGQDPAGQEYNLSLIYAFFMTILCHPEKATWEMFRGACLAKIPPESRSGRALRLVSFAFSLAVSALTNRSFREEDSSKVTLLLHVDGTFTIQKGAEKLKKASRKKSELSASDNKSSTDVTRGKEVLPGPSPSLEDVGHRE